MPCILTDNEGIFNSRHRGFRPDPHPEIPNEPICRPKKSQRSITILIVSLWFTYFILSPHLQLKNYDANLCLHSFITVTLFLLPSVYKKYLNSRLQNPYYNPAGYMYQGKILDWDDPHYRLHLEYYKRHKTWVLPDGINPDDYISQN